MYNRSAWKVSEDCFVGRNNLLEFGNIVRVAQFHIIAAINHKQRNWSVNHERREISICCGVEGNLTGRKSFFDGRRVSAFLQGVVKRRSFLKGLGIASAT